MSVWQRSRRTVAVILIGYFGVGILTRATGEIFPIWSWFLFASVPQTSIHYSVLLLEVEGAELSEPVIFQHSNGLVPSPHDTIATLLMDRLGRALEAKNPESESLRKTLETNFMPRVTRYSIVRLTYRPLEYYRTKTHERREIATFEVKP